MAVAHTIVVIGYRLQKNRCDYQGLDFDYSIGYMPTAFNVISSNDWKG